MIKFLKRIFRPLDSLTGAQLRMQREWDERARKNALHYIADFKEDWEDLGEFFKTGYDDATKFLNDAGWSSEMTRDAVLVEIGCGVGRMTRTFSTLFARVIAIDVSREMITRARQYNADLKNVSFVVGDGTSLGNLRTGSCDFVLSYIVFQHMPHAELIYKYIDDSLRVLKPGGRFRFQARNDFRAKLPDTYDGDSIEIPRVERIAQDHNAEILCREGLGTILCYLEIRKL